MSNSANKVDSVAILLLCSAGLACNLLIWIAGSSQYGYLSTIWQKVGMGTLLGCSFASFLVAALMLRRLYRVAHSRPKVALVFFVVSASPFAFFVAVLVARFAHGE